MPVTPDGDPAVLPIQAGSQLIVNLRELLVFALVTTVLLLNFVAVLLVRAVNPQAAPTGYRRRGLS